MSERFEVIEDKATADICLRIKGKDIEELFENAAYALFSVISDIDQIDAKETKEIELSANNRNALLVDYLNELIYHWDAKKMLYNGFNCEINESEKEIRLISDNLGEKYNHQTHDLYTEVKAATYYGLDIKNTKQHLTCEITLDV